MITWKYIHRLIDKFSKQVSFKILINSSYSEDTGLPTYIYKTIYINASLQPVKKKGAIGGENEIAYEFDDTGSWESGAFIMISKSNYEVKVKDEIKDITINGKNYGDAFIDRVQDWSDGNGLYKARVLLKSMYPSREDF